jgi:D-alanine-D-alanine ligase
LPKKIRVGLIFGGQSGEHEISIRSARTVAAAFDQRKYEVVPIGISREGRWLGPATATALLAGATPLKAPAKSRKWDTVAILADSTRPGLLRITGARNGPTLEHLDVVFPLLHGTFGEDGTIQGLLEMSGLPYVGGGVLASATGMDKVIMKSLFAHAGLPICRYVWFLRSAWEAAPARILNLVKRKHGFPCFVKPANLGSSVGISKATDRKSLVAAIDLAAQYDRKIIVEEGLDVREVECGILGNDDPEASLPGEYVVSDDRARFLDYAEKYTETGHVEFVVPAPIPKDLTTRVRQLALRAFKAVDGSGLARVDFFLRRDNGELLVNELNTMPGLTEVSGYPKMWAASGVPLPQVLDRLVQLALERHQDRSRNQTNFQRYF